MRSNERTTTVAGKTYTWYGDYNKRGTYATCEATGETKRIYGGGYIHNELTVRKAIAAAFQTGTFRK